jgi:hypothetical protein
MAAAINYTEVTERTRKTVMSYAQEQWPVIKSSSGVEVSFYENANTDTPGKVFKAVGIVRAPPATTFEYILPGALRLHWDKQVKSCEIVTMVEEGTAILRTLSNGAAMGLISPREYLDLVAISRNTETGLHLSYSTGIDFPYPEDPSYVRGINHPSTMMCFPLDSDPNCTKLVYAFQTDLKGMIPPKLIDATLPSIQVTFFKNLRKAIKERMREKTGKTCML